MRRRGSRNTLVLVGAAWAVLTVSMAAPAQAADRPNTRAGASSSSAQGVWLSETLASGGDVDYFRFTTSTTRHVRVVLGQLPANYTLGVYSYTGTLMGQSARGGRVAEEVYRSLPAGSWYVKVTSAAGAYDASRPYLVRFQTYGEAVHPIGFTSYVDSIGYTHVVGEVLNNTSSRRRFVKVTATLYNSSNQVVGTDFTYTHRSIVGARARAPFHLLFEAPPGFHHFRLTASGDATTASAVGGLSIRPGPPFTDSIGYRHYPGEVKNTNTFGVKYVSVEATGYDWLGRVVLVDFTYTDPTSIPAGGVAPYELLFEQPTNMVHLVQNYEASR